MTQSLENSVVLVTGGTGSFGRTVVAYLASLGVGEIRVFSRDEKKQDDMRREFNDRRISFYLGDVRDRVSVGAVVKDADYVFHAAALKQVPSCEFFPMEAYRTNVVGTDNLVSLSIQSGVKSIVCLSTDKAVYPINAMGISKAMLEKVALSYARDPRAKNTVISITRYGNVVTSRGSVIPLFVDQIIKKNRLTITDPNMTRFLMTLEDSVELVMKAFRTDVSGQLFVKKAKAATIGAIARTLCKIYSVPFDPRIIGRRHGEKEHECLVGAEEMASCIDEGGYYTIPLDDRSLNYELYFDKGSQITVTGQEYCSNSRALMSDPDLESLLLSLPLIKETLGK